MFYLCHSKPRGSSFPFRTPLFRTRYLIKREVQWPCMSCERVDSLISLQLRGSPFTNAPSDTQWHTGSGLWVLLKRCLASRRRWEHTFQKRAKWWSLDVGRSSFGGFGGFGHRLMPLCNHTWPSILKRRSLTRTLGPTWDPLSLSTGCQCIWCRTSTCRTWKQRCRFHIFHQLPGALGMWRFRHLDLDHFLRIFFWNNLRKNTKKMFELCWTSHHRLAQVLGEPSTSARPGTGHPKPIFFINIINLCWLLKHSRHSIIWHLGCIDCGIEIVVEPMVRSWASGCCITNRSGTLQQSRGLLDISGPCVSLLTCILHGRCPSWHKRISGHVIFCHFQLNSRNCTKDDDMHGVCSVCQLSKMRLDFQNF